MIQTERLWIIPLDAENLEMWVYDIDALEKKLCVKYRAEPMMGFFREIVKGQLEITKADPSNYEWHSFWLIVRKSDSVIVGSADFKDVPDDNGITEIGYGIGKEYEHNGYVTETVLAMCDWAGINDAKAVIAETDLGAEGEKSRRVLARCGFSLYPNKGENWFIKKLQ